MSSLRGRLRTSFHPSLGSVLLVVLALGLSAWSLPARAGLVSHFTFDETLEDQGPGGNDGVFFGEVDPFYVDGFDGTPAGAVLFDGVDDYVRLTPNQGLPLSANPSFSVAMWVNGVGTIDNVDDRVFSESSSTVNNTLYNIGTHNLGSGPNVDFFVRNAAGTSTGHIYSAGSAFDGVWHHIALVDDNGTVRLYIDGILDSAILNYNVSLRGPTDTTTIGEVRRDSHATIPDCCNFTGTIDDVRLYDHALTQVEVCALISCAACPVAGDTHCDDILVEGPPTGGPGLYRLTALDALDENGGTILYSFVADNGAGTVLTAGPQASNFAELVLAQGTWTLGVTVDDDPNCNDVADDATCSRMLEVTCPSLGDTRCENILVDGQEGDTPGTYLVTAVNASDDNADPITFLFTADNGVDAPLVVGPGALDSAYFTLAAGSWTLAVSVDDDPLCADELPEATRATTVVVNAAPAGIISRFGFEESIEDLEPSANDGVFFGDVAPIFVDGADAAPASAISFDGFDDYVAFTQNRNLSLYAHSTYTVAFWVKGLPAQVDRRVFSEGSTRSNNPLLNLGTHNQGLDGTLDVYIRADTGQVLVPHIHSARTVFDDTWHHVAWVDDDGRGVIYIDGVRDSTSVNYRRGRLTNDTTSVGGILRAVAGSFFTGAVDDLRLFNAALGLTEVEALVPEPSGCPGVGDTHCGQLAVVGPGDERVGQYTLTATGAVDESGDPIIYTFTAQRGDGTYLQSGPAAADSATFYLGGGVWTLTVSVDDDLLCRDHAVDDSCAAGVTVVPRIISRWKLDGDLLDSEPSANHGAFPGGAAPTYVPGENGMADGAVSFNGAGDFIQVQHASGLPAYALPEFTVALWVKGLPQQDRRVWSESSSVANSALFNIGTHFQALTGQVDIFIRDAAGAITFNHRLSDGIAFDDTWHHIAWVDRQGAAILYIDGVADATDFTYIRPAINFDTTTLGGILRQAGTCCLWTGSMDDVRLYDFPLSPEEIAEVIAGEVEPRVLFVRGDPDANGRLELTDAIVVLNFLFIGSNRPRCFDAADSDDNGRLELTDAVRVLNYLFIGSAAPPAPSPSTANYARGDCGADPREEAPDLGCETLSPTCAP